jgi:hypothetical protein
MDHPFCPPRSLFFALFPSFTLSSLRPNDRSKGRPPHFSDRLFVSRCVSRGMFDDDQPFGRDIQHLTPLDKSSGSFSEILLAGSTSRDLMHDDLVWLACLGQRIAFVAFLGPWLLAALLVQALRFLLPGKPIRGRRQVAVVAIFGQTLFYLLQPAVQYGYLLMQGLIFCPQSSILCSQSGIFFSKVMQFFFLSHAATLPFLDQFDKASRRPE